MKQQQEFIAAVKVGNLARVKQMVEDKIDATSSTKKPSALETNHVHEIIPTQPLLQICACTSSSAQVHSMNDSSQSTDASSSSGGPHIDDANEAAARLAVAQYLISHRNPSVNFRLLDDEGRGVLHVAAKKGDLNLAKAVLSVRDERRTEIDINGRCGKQGWTALHYAVQQADMAMCRLLVECGANMTMNGGLNGKGHTPLELVRAKLQNGSHLSPAYTAALQAVAKELSEAIRNAERIKLQKELERQEKEEKLLAEKQKQLEKEAKERELLLRKQKQLKEKQDRERQRDEGLTKSDPKKAGVAAGTGTVGSVGGTSKAVSTPTPPVAQPSGTSSNVNPTTNVEMAGAGAGVGAGKKKKKKDKDGKAKGTEESSGAMALGGSGSSLAREPSAALAAADVSRDELLDHLLAMGFAEADCLAAISSCGGDMDRAITWLCEKPLATTSTPTITSSVSTVGGVGSSGSSGSSSSSGGGGVTGGGSTSGGGGQSGITKKGSNGGQSESQAALEAAKLQTQKEKDLKDELRRVNRAWNAKAEEEKKKVGCATVDMNK